MKRRHIIFSILLLMIITYITPVNACPFTFNDYKKTGEEHSFIVGDYVFDLSSGFSPSLEDFAVAARTIPEEMDEYVYEITYVPQLGLYNQLEIFSNNMSSSSSKWPSFFDTTYNYRTSININDPDYDIFTCKTNAIKVNYSLLNTKGEGDYKTEASRVVDIQANAGLGSAKYCLTSENECTPNNSFDVSGTSSTATIDYETNELPQRVCTEAYDKDGNTSGVVCDNVMVKVDSSPIKIEQTDEYSNIIEGTPHTVQGLFDVEYSVSGGNVYYFYYDNDDKYILSNLADLPSGEITVEAIGRSGSGLISESDRVITVRKNVVTYDYKTNGGVSVSAATGEVEYNGRANLNIIAERPGYEFVGWNTDPDARYALDLIDITSDTNLYAIFRKVVEVHFNIYNKQGNIPAVPEYDVDTCEIYNNETDCEVTVPGIEARVGYEALGWSIDGDDTPEYFGGEKIKATEDLEFYSVTKYIIPNTGTVVTVKDGEISKETESCYLYNGETSCKIDVSDIHSDDLDGRPPKGITSDPDKVTPVEGEIDLTGGENYYVYYEDEFTVNFVSDEEHVETIKADVIYIVTEEGVVTIPDKVSIPSPAPKDNYEIVGWRDDLKEEDATIHPGDKVPATSNTTYYAIYAKEITVNYESASGTTNIPNSQKGRVYYNSGSKRTSSAVITIDSGLSIARAGYIFDGWTSGGKDYVQGVTLSLDTNMTFTAKWTDHATLVIFDYETNGGQSVTHGATTYRHGVTSPIDLTKIEAYKRGYEFVGWSTQANAQSATMTSFTPDDGESRVTLYAIFRRDVRVRYININQSVLTIDSAASEDFVIFNNSNGKEITLPNVTSNNPNVEFLGWSTTPGKTDVEYRSGDKVTIKENTTFYTIIRNNVEYVSTYVYYDGTTRKTKDVACKLYNDDVTCKTEFNPGNVKYNGAIVTGWSTNPNSIVLSEEQVINGSATFYAVYTKQAVVKYYSGLNTDTNVPTSTSNIVSLNYLTSTSDVKSISRNVTLENPDGIAGFTTLGWRTDKNADVAQYYNRSILPITDNIDLYAVYYRNVTISYTSLGGSPNPSSETKMIRYNTGIKNPADEVSFTVGAAPTKTGVELDAWLVENDESKRYQPGQTVVLKTSSKLYAKYKARKFRITLNGKVNGGENPTTNVIDYDYDAMFNLNDYSAPSKNGFTFVGWSLSPNSKEIISEFRVPAEPTTLYAVYKKTLKANWVMYDTKAGTANSSYTTCDIYNNETTCYAQAGTINIKAGYSAIGWSKNGGSLDINAGIGLTTPITQDTNFYSITKVTNDLVATFYYYNNNSIVNVSSSCGLYNGATSCSIAAPSSPANYSTAPFNAWSSRNNGYTAASFNINANTNFYAHYKQITELNYNSGAFSNDVAASKSTETYSVEYVANPSSGWKSIPNATLKSPATLNNFNILGWSEDKSMTTQTLNVNSQLSMLQSHTLYAVYNRTLTLSYNVQGGTPARANQTTTQYYNSGSGKTTHTFTLAAAVSKTGYTYNNWRVNSTSGTAYNAGAQINILEDTVMHAYFTPNNYTLYFNKNTGNDPSPASKTVTFDAAYGTLASITKKGHSLVGWFTAASGGTQVTASTTVKTAGDHTIYAQWTPNTYYVTMSVTNGTAGSSQVAIVYPGSNTVTIKPNNGTRNPNAPGYYLSSITCDNGYTVTGYTTGRSATGQQTITINNNNNDKNATCTVTYTTLNYSATVNCSGDRYVSNGHCMRNYPDEALFGCAQYNERAQAPCTAKTCANESAFGCAEYYSKAEPPCNPIYDRKSEFGCEQYEVKEHDGCDCQTWGTESETLGGMPASVASYCMGKSECNCTKTGNHTIVDGVVVGDETKCTWKVCTKRKSCPTTNCIKYKEGIVGYETCENSAFGCKTPNSRQDGGVCGYHSCRDSSFGCQTANSGPHIEDSYRSYSCPNGGTANNANGMCEF